MIMLILSLAILGLVIYLIETYIPMAEPFKMAIRVIVLVVVVIWLVQLLGLDLPLPRLGTR